MTTDTATTERPAPGKGLAIIADPTPEIFTAEKATEIVAGLRAEIMLIDRDVSTQKGRDNIRSMAAKIASSKTAADKFAKGLKDEYQKKANGIQAIRNIFWDGLEALQKDFRAPLTEFEDAEKARVAKHEAALADIALLSLFDGEATTDIIADRLTIAKAIATGAFQEFTARADAAKADAVAKLEAMLAAAQARDAERAELERLRQEAAERAAREEAERIEREKQEAAARAAEQARREAEEKARREREEAERAAAAERERVERERVAAEERAAEAERRAKEAAEKAERDRIAGHERALKSIEGMIADACSPFNGSDMIREITRIMDGMAEMTRDWEEFSERAAAVIADGRERIASRLSEVERREEDRRQKAEAEREASRVEAERKAEADKLAAVEEAARAERERIEAQQRAEEEAARKREADKVHRGRINRAAMEALVAAGLSEADARKAVEAIAKGNVPAVRISY